MQRQHSTLGGIARDALHDRIVDRVRWAAGKRCGAGTDEIGILRARCHRGTTGVENVGAETFDLPEPGRSLHDINTAVPQITTLGQIAPGAVGVGLFDKARDLGGAAVIDFRPALDIAVAGLGRTGLDTESHHAAFKRQRNRL